MKSNGELRRSTRQSKPPGRLRGNLEEPRGKEDISRRTLFKKNHKNGKNFDICIRNITALGRDRRKTAETLEIFISKEIIRQGLDNTLALVDNLKVLEMSRDHDGTTYIAFCRMERLDRHGEAIEFMNSMTLEGRKLQAKLNDIESGTAQWS
ncbi:hypothetical protein BpHYR1_034094 [Brachionus plicatilis]|uniref:Uncharacterized protein n=1 Tax=Brachionus plicatilis TaxID=10195 RepID=A0A3M7PLA4_BRAPC|nr:hypothetical protein BpHYR1_034094 [Brachionus plicatilis]